VTRKIVERFAKEAGVSPDILTTMADIYPGLGDVEPYNETVVLAPGVDRDSEDAVRWEGHLLREYMKSRASVTPRWE